MHEALHDDAVEGAEPRGVAHGFGLSGFEGVVQADVRHGGGDKEAEGLGQAALHGDLAVWRRGENPARQWCGAKFHQCRMTVST